MLLYTRDNEGYMFVLGILSWTAIWNCPHLDNIFCINDLLIYTRDDEGYVLVLDTLSRDVMEVLYSFVSRIFLRGDIKKNCWGGGLTKKLLKKHQKLVYIQICYVLRVGQTFFCGGGNLPPPGHSLDSWRPILFLWIVLKSLFSWASISIFEPLGIIS